MESKQEYFNFIPFPTLAEVEPLNEDVSVQSDELNSNNAGKWFKRSFVLTLSGATTCLAAEVLKRVGVSENVTHKLRTTGKTAIVTGVTGLVISGVGVLSPEIDSINRVEI